MIKNITIVSCHSRVGGNLDTCFRRYDTKFVSPNSIGFTINSLLFYFCRCNFLDCRVVAKQLLAMTFIHFSKQILISLVATFKLPWIY
ncbi:hypothetical protein [Candidatus Tisiphia endosymbiont of Hybos culiciformis]|uniref:hypothetical protein n=1 Tax=Candidatus Tisiphia endosymbiont of Hybos culiciformis TaxID=3139331 RepID=UPI003CCB2E93